MRGRSRCRSPADKTSRRSQPSQNCRPYRAHRGYISSETRSPLGYRPRPRIYGLRDPRTPRRRALGLTTPVYRCGHRRRCRPPVARASALAYSAIRRPQCDWFTTVSPRLRMTPHPSVRPEKNSSRTNSGRCRQNLGKCGRFPPSPKRESDALAVTRPSGLTTVASACGYSVGRFFA